MITQLRIRNFKAWKDTGDVKLAPLTVFFGKNSSGKSSIGQFLMMLRQTAALPDRARVLHPGDKNTSVDLGSFQDLIFNHDTKAELDFSFAWQERQDITIRDVLNDEKFVGNRISFNAVVSVGPKPQERLTCKKFNYDLGKDDHSEVLSAGMYLKPTNKYALSCKHFKPVRKPGRAWELPSPNRFYGFPDEVAAYFQNAGALSDLQLAFQNTLKKLFYLGPLRDFPLRQYSWSGDTPEEVGFRGGDWVSALLAARARKISPGMGKSKAIRAEQFQEIIARWLKELGLISSFTVVPVASGSREYQVKVRLTSSSEFVSIPDVGFGVSQILPILVECFYAPSDSTIIIEQPELHLHPAVQQSLADLFIEVINSRENGERRIQLLIESHSEHFLRRLQRRIAEGTVSRDHVKAYFCHPGSEAEGSKIDELRVDDFGAILNWPTDFFGDQITDIAEAQKAGIRRRRETTKAKSVSDNT